jgi:eukaryotic-like serine/threonine-protein kinase
MADQHLPVTKTVAPAPASETVDYHSRTGRTAGPSLAALSPSAAWAVRLRNRLRVINLLFAALFSSFVLLALARILSGDPTGRASGWRSLPVYLPSVLSYGGVAAVLFAVRRPGPRVLTLAQWATVATAGVCCGFFHLEKLFDNREGSMELLLRLHPSFAGMGFSFAWYSFAIAYGTFIPNGWRQCAAQTGLIVAAPVALTLAVAALVPRLAPLLLGPYVLVMAGFLAVGYGTVVYGAYTVSKLKEDVAQAQRIGQYRLREKLGEGGMGVVYKAEHRLLKRPCAIKLIRPRTADPAEGLARFEREVRAMASLSHWNTVEVYDYGVTDQGDFYYVMELLDGLTAHAVVDRHGPMPPARVVHVLRQVCAALGEAHARDLIHRDVSPRNVFLANVGGQADVVKLLDFGLVHDRGHQLDAVSLTQEGVPMGTPGYMAPEQAAGGRALDGRADLYAVGAVGFYLLTGQRPFAGETPLRILSAQLVGAVQPLAELAPGCPADLAGLIGRCLALAPEDRPGTAAELDAALAGCVGTGAWGAAEAAAWWKARRAQPR